MLITKQYVVFGKVEEEVFKQLCKIRDEFDYAGWRVSLNDRYPFTHFSVINNNIRIGVYSCIVGISHGIRWDNCWISNRVSEEEIESIIMPMAISDTPEIHFF